MKANRKNINSKGLLKNVFLLFAAVCLLIGQNVNDDS